MREWTLKEATSLSDAAINDLIGTDRTSLREFVWARASKLARLIEKSQSLGGDTVGPFMKERDELLSIYRKAK